jgi:hypothetical protein
MSRQASILTVSPSNITASNIQTDFKQAIGTGSSGAVITLGKYRIFMISAFATSPTSDAGINVSFGTAGASFNTPTSAYFLLPFGQVFTLDMGPSCDSVQFFNNSGVSADVYIKTMSVN